MQPRTEPTRKKLSTQQEKNAIIHFCREFQKTSNTLTKKKPGKFCSLLAVF